MKETITQKDACYSHDIVKMICEAIGPGLPGTLQERARALIIKKELEKHLGSENVTIEEFAFSPGSFLGSHRLSALFTLLAALLNILVGTTFDHPSWEIAAVAVLSLAFAIFPVLQFIFQFTLAGEIIDPLFKQTSSM